MDAKFDVSLDEMDFSTTQSQLPKPNQDGSTFSKKKKRFLMEGMWVTSDNNPASMVELLEWLNSVPLGLGGTCVRQKKVDDSKGKRVVGGTGVEKKGMRRPIDYFMSNEGLKCITTKEKDEGLEVSWSLVE
ncbi:hypothetical protein PVK06_028719 [Gossypium arboreum]|uniref:Uncharacterized protein n=1 Tax=Gossypium arboreum TaxID=29729 RepID=A0ABR0P4L9_GOSAR|nr:hypothetical protein PVK06_028719 [Gossypium arboreum]